MVGRGMAYGSIAHSLHNLRSLREGEEVSPLTIRAHVQQISRKLPANVEGSTPYRRVMRWVLEQQRAA